MSKKESQYVLGVRAAASLAGQYDGASSHAYRIEDCILYKLNLRKGVPRRNAKKQEPPADAFMRGFASALSEIYRLLAGGNDAAGIARVARDAGLTLTHARQIGCHPIDLKALGRAGVRP